MRRTLILVVCLAGVAPADLDRDATLGLVSYYERAKHWALKGMVLLALGPEWHPDGATMVAKALRDRDRRVRPFALEALHATGDDTLRRVAHADLVDALVGAQRVTNRYFADRAREVLARVAPAVAATTSADWTTWWEANQAAYQPLPWTEPKEAPKERRTKAEPFLEHLFDLQNAGLEVCICIDSTSSMQPAIDAARDAVHDTVEVLGAIAPDFRIGLVTYRDDEDMMGGATVLAKLSRRADTVRRRLDALRAAGGGDRPERVERGLELALDPRMGWRRDANKVVILVGDAPPKDRAKAERLAREAHRKPFGKEPVTRKGRRSVRPFVVSAIAIGSDAAESFPRITRVAGGSVSLLPAPRPGRASRRMSGLLKHLLTLAFGKRWEEQLGAFLRILDRYKRERFLR